jgi:hypothetical protein
MDGVDPTRMIVRYARDLRMDDLRMGNAVLIGSVESDPWIEIFEPQMNFRQRVSMDPLIPSGSLNMHAHPGERNLYGTPGQDHTYSLIAYLPNLSSMGRILTVGGPNTAGMQAATNFLFTPSLMEPTLRRARAAHGQIRSFELLVSAGNFSSNASAPHSSRNASTRAELIKAIKTPEYPTVGCGDSWPTRNCRWWSHTQ